MQQEAVRRKERSRSTFAGRFKKLSRRVRYWILQRCRLAMIGYGKALLLWNLGQEEADASFQSLIDKMENRGIQPLQKAAIYQSYGTVLCRSGRNTEGFSYLEKSLDEITNVWHP